MFSFNKFRKAVEKYILFFCVLFSGAVFAVEGTVYGTLRTFDLRDYRCDLESGSTTNCKDATRTVANYDTATLALKGVRVEVRRADSNLQICASYTDDSGYFECSYNAGGSSVEAYLRIEFRDSENRFKLRRAESRGDRTVQAFANYPQDNGWAPFVLSGGMQNASTHNANVVLYGDNVSEQDMIDANVYAEAYYAFEQFEQSGIYDAYLRDHGYTRIIMVDDFFDGFGGCCSDSRTRLLGFDRPATERNTQRSNGIILSPGGFNHEDYPQHQYPNAYRTSTVLHELSHLVISKAQVKELGADKVALAVFNTNSCFQGPPASGVETEFSRDGHSSCYQPIEGFAYMMAAAMIWSPGAQPGEAFVYGPLIGAPITFENVTSSGCSYCNSSNRTTVLNGMRYFWDLYDTYNEGNQSACEADTVSLGLLDVVRHYLMKPVGFGDGSLNGIFNPGLPGGNSTESGLYDMSRLANLGATGSTSSGPFINVWKNACSSPGDFVNRNCISEASLACTANFSHLPPDADGVNECIDSYFEQYCL